MRRRYLGQAPQISFTSDFHELLVGDLQPGTGLKLRYDPDRLSPPPSYKFAEPRFPVFAKARFLENGAVTVLTLTGLLTSTPDRDPTGQGSMLTGTLDVPRDAQFVELWFEGHMPDGTHWDSDYGQNFWFRFPYADLQVTATVLRRDALARFRVEVTSVNEVERVAVRFVDLTRGATEAPREEPLQLTALTEERRRLWTYETSVDSSALIRFKLYYWIVGRRFKDDNSGQYYLADHPDLVERAPQLPQALVEAARYWQQRLKT